MWLSIISVILFEIIGAYFLTVVLQVGLIGLWAVQIVDETSRFSLNYFRFRGGKNLRFSIGWMMIRKSRKKILDATESALGTRTRHSLLVKN